MFASKVKSRNIFSDISSCFVSCCGGEVKDLSKLTNDIREDLLEELELFSLFGLELFPTFQGGALGGA